MMESSHEVIENLMRNQPSSRMGLRENVWPQTLKKWILQGYYPTDEQGEPADPAEHFKHDWAIVDGGFDILPIRGFREVIEESEEWEIVRNGAGADLKYWKEQAGTPEHIAFSMTNPKIWEESYRFYLLELDRQRFKMEETRKALELRKQQKKWSVFNCPFIFENMRQSMGDVCLYESSVLEPEWVHDYCRIYTDFYMRHFQVLFEEVGQPDGIRICEDLGYKNGLFCSPKSLAELIFPYYKELVDFFHSYNIPVLLHSCGGVEKALDMIVAAGFDSLDPMERAAGCDPLKFAELTENRLVLIGGFDKRILESGDRTNIKQEVITLLKNIREHGVRYIFSTDHSISTNVEYADYRYMVDIYRDNMMY